jgi:hypothetical protein
MNTPFRFFLRTKHLHTSLIHQDIVEILFDTLLMQHLHTGQENLSMIFTSAILSANTGQRNQAVIVPSGPRVSDWCFVGPIESDPPVVSIVALVKSSVRTNYSLSLSLSLSLCVNLSLYLSLSISLSLSLSFPLSQF